MGKISAKFGYALGDPLPPEYFCQCLFLFGIKRIFVVGPFPAGRHIVSVFCGKYFMVPVGRGDGNGLKGQEDAFVKAFFWQKVSGAVDPKMIPR